MLTVVAFGTAVASSAACGIDATAALAVAAAGVAADQHLAAAGRAGGVERRRLDLDVLAGDLDGAALAASCSATSSLPDTLTVCVGSAGDLGRCGRAAEHDLAVALADRARLDHAGVVDDGIDHRARRAAVSSTRPPLALSLPSFLTSALSGWPVATSFTVARDRIVDRRA